MKYTQSILKAMNRTMIEQSLRYDEKIACKNATVVVDGEGNVSAWFDNDHPVVVIQED